MVCKEDVIAWFKEAASHRRIDVMCSLLNMCIPFELRYLGTYIEEQGKHDYQELRGATLNANSTENLAKEFHTSKGILDKCARHRATVYLSVLQSRNYSCANWLYHRLLRTDSLDALVANGNLSKDASLHTELVLLFTLALNHPAFTFEQKRYFGDVVSRLTEPEGSGALHLPCPPGLGYAVKPPLAVPVPVQHLLAAGKEPLPPPGLPVPPLWSRTPLFAAGCPAPPPPDLAAFPPPLSPLVSQHSSPTASRSVSPTRLYPCRPLPSPRTHLDRLPPPPPLKDPLVLPAPPTQYNTDLKSVPIEEVNVGEMNENPQQPWLEPVVALPNGLLGSGPGAPVYLPGELQALSLGGDVSPRCTSSSASSNSSDCLSPPDTPTDVVVAPHGPGRGAVPPPGLAPAASCTVPYSSHYSVPPPPPPAASFHSRSLFYSPAYRHQFPPAPAYQQNGELPYLFPPYLPVMYSSAAPPPPPKVTCYNCGLAGHAGADCKEPTIEEITQKKGYQLDYTSPPPPPPDAPPADKPH